MHDHDDSIHVYIKSWFKHILFDQSLYHKYDIIEVGSDSISRVKSMHYILLLSQMSKLQFCSESNYAAIFQLNSLPCKILFLASDWDFFFEIGKKEDILDWEWGLYSHYSAPANREKRPCKGL